MSYNERSSTTSRSCPEHAERQKGWLMVRKKKLVKELAYQLRKLRDLETISNDDYIVAEISGFYAALVATAFGVSRGDETKAEAFLFQVEVEASWQSLAG